MMDETDSNSILKLLSPIKSPQNVDNSKILVPESQKKK